MSRADRRFLRWLATFCAPAGAEVGRISPVIGRLARRGLDVAAIATLLDGLYALNGAPPPDEGLYRVIDFIETSLAEERFTESDQLLAGADVKRLHVDVLVASLCSTLAAKEKLPHRASFVESVRSELRRRQIEEFEIGEILDGLE